MGFFDRKSWRLRRKIKDLQAELREAEKEGKYIVEQGLFFAEAEDMGNATMLVFGAGEPHDPQEEEVVRTFFDRNGFSVESLKLDRTRVRVADAEIIPPAELLMAIVRVLRDEGYRIIDDGEQERPANLAEKVYPISALARAVTRMFAENVRSIIAGSGIKMTKEGNRLLSWMPSLIEALGKKIDVATVEVARRAFEHTFERYYIKPFEKPAKSAGVTAKKSQEREPPDGLLGSAAPSSHVEADPKQILRDILREAQKSVDEAYGRFSMRLTRQLEGRLSQWLAAAGSGVAQPGGAPPAPDLHDQQSARLVRSEQLATVLAAMYHALVKANPTRCVSNAEALLNHVQRFFNATAACLLVPTQRGDAVAIYAQAGKKLLWSESGAKGFAISSSIIRECLWRRAVVTSEPEQEEPSPSMLRFQIEGAAAAPIMMSDRVAGVLYLDRREGGPTAFSPEDCEDLCRVAQVFQEFPDLTLGLA